MVRGSHSLMHLAFNLLRVAALCTAAVICSRPLQAEFTVSGRQLLKDGAPFTIKGVCYNPTPIGDNGSRSPNGDYYTSNYSAIWDRDLPKLRALGANVIRIYGWNPTADHSAFLNRCYNNGDHPLYVLVNYWVDPATDWTNTKAVKAITSNFTNIENRLGSNPAVLGLIVGNEVNNQNGNGGKPAFWSAMNSVASSIKSLNPRRLVSVAITDALDQMAWADPTMTSIDFWCMQLYRGPSFGSFFSDFAARSARPVVISEYGYDAFNHAANAPYPDGAAYSASVLVNLASELANASAVSPGGCLFEYCDEWFRAPGGTDTTQDPGGWYTSGFPDGCADEEWWGLFSIASNGSLPNTLTERAAYGQLMALWNPSAPAPTPTVPPPSTTGPISDPSFESVSVGTNQYGAFAYNPVISNWTFAGYSGVAGNNSGFTSGNAPAPDGTQVAFVQMTGTATVRATLSAGTYVLSAQTANRLNYGGQQTVSVLLDGVEIGRFTGGASYAEASTGSFTVAAGTHDFTFAGLSTTDATLFLDQISLGAVSGPVAVAIGSSGFENPNVGANTFSAFLYNPVTVAGSQGWRFEGNSGVTGNGSGFTSLNPVAPEGGQVAFVQTNTGVVSQTVTLPAASSYSLSVKAAKRGVWDQGHQSVQVLVDGVVVGTIAPNGTNYETDTVAFAAPAGAHVLAFRGTAADDSTVLIDSVQLTAMP